MDIDGDGQYSLASTDQPVRPKSEGERTQLGFGEPLNVKYEAEYDEREDDNEDWSCVPCNPVEVAGEAQEEDDDDAARVIGEELGDDPAEDTQPTRRSVHNLPSLEARRKHELTHIPFRPWCRACVAARKPDWPHHSLGQTRAMGTVPEVHVDYCFFRSRPGEESTPTLIIKDRESLAIAAHVVPFKGGDSEWTVRQVCRDLRKWGIRGDLTLRCDQEPALVDLCNQVARQRQDDWNVRTFIENSPVADSQGNGFIEAGVKTIEGMVRTLKFAVEEKIQKKIEADMLVFMWLVEHAADLVCKYQIGVDGKTPFERLRGKPYRGEALEFGCSVFHRVPGKPQGGDLQWRWLEGIWLGTRFESCEHVVAMDDGSVVRTRSVQAFPEETRWDADRILGVTGKPWAPTGTTRATRPSAPQSEVPARGDDHAHGGDRGPLPRGMLVRRKHVEKFGFTEKCRKCRAIREGDLTQPTLGHSEACRQRMHAMAKDDDELKERAYAAERRRGEHEQQKQRRHQDSTTRTPGEQDRDDHTGQERSKRRKTEDDLEHTQAKKGSTSRGGKGKGGKDRVEKESNEDEANAGNDDSHDKEHLRDEGRGVGDIPLPTAVGGGTAEDGHHRKRGYDENDEERELRRMQSRVSGEQPKRKLGDAGDDDDGRRTQPRTASARGEDGHLIGAVDSTRSRYDICEAFSPPRIALRARERGLRGGWSLDLLTDDPISGRKWDLSQPKDVAKVKQMLRQDRPELLVLSPPCTMFSQLQHINGGPDPVRLRSAIVLFETAVDLCLYQARIGGRFILEHPRGSSAWKLPCMARLLEIDGLVRADFHMCASGVTSVDEFGEGHVYKPTSMISNSFTIAAKVERRCSGGHRHVHLVNGRAKAAAIYPRHLCDCILDGLEVEMSSQSEKKALNAMTVADDLCDPGDNAQAHASDERHGGAPECREKVDHHECGDWDLIKMARHDEIKTFLSIPVYEYVTVDEMNNDPDAKEIDTTWVDKNKGTELKPVWSSRLCAREFAAGDDRDDLFAATPPLMATKLLISECASQQPGKGEKRLMILDVKRAFLHGRMKRSVYIRLPPEDPRAQEHGIRGRLLRAMYGTRDAPQIWQEEVKRVLQMFGFRASVTNPCVYFHEAMNVQVVAHVDDFLMCGERRHLEEIYKGLAGKFELKRKVLGPGVGETLEVEFLGRSSRWTDAGIEYEADQKHVQALLDEAGMINCRPVVNPGGAQDERRRKDERAVEIETLLDGRKAREYRRAAARLNYLALDRPDVSFAVKEVARAMASPCIGDEMRLKRVLRYLRGCPRAAFLFKWQPRHFHIRCQVDSDWAGCVRTRRSTSGGLLTRGGHCLGHWSRTQATVALSSGEAELNAAVKGGVELLGIRELLLEWGEVPEVGLEGDSTACKGTLYREGVGKQKHLEVRQLWLQERIKLGRLAYDKIDREINPADALTKHWGPSAHKHFCMMGLRLIKE